MVYDKNARESDVTALEKLAAELGERGFGTRIHAPEGRVPALTVTNPRASRLTETVTTGDGSFWWSWAERIAPVADVGSAADVITRVLAYGNSST